MAFIGEHINNFIIISGIIVFILIVINFVQLKSHKKTIENLLTGKKRESKINSHTGKQEYSEVHVEADPEDIRQKEDEFHKSSSFCNTLSQFVPIFPLLGILGTVSALITLVDAGDIAAMMGSLGVALYSTFWGLICSIFLKVAIALNFKVILDTEAIYSSNDKGFNTNIALKNVTDEVK